MNTAQEELTSSQDKGNDDRPSTKRELSPPVSTTVSTSSPHCFLTGEPPFIINTTYECTTSRPIWALILQDSERGGGTEIRDPERLSHGNPRRVGPTSIVLCTDGMLGSEMDRVEIEDSILLRLEPGQKFSTYYKISAVERKRGFGSDMRMMSREKSYKVTLRQRCWRWMFEDEMGDLDENGRRGLLKKVTKTTWNVDCSTTFTTV